LLDLHFITRVLAPFVLRLLRKILLHSQDLSSTPRGSAQHEAQQNGAADRHCNDISNQIRSSKQPIIVKARGKAFWLLHQIANLGPIPRSILQ